MEKEGIIYVPFAYDDYDDALALWERTPGIGLSTADGRAAIASFLEANPGLSFAAKEGGVVIGTALCGSDGRRGYLYHLAVEAGHCRRGIGKTLAGRCLETLKSRGIEKCHLFVLDGNDGGTAFWSGIGWARRGDIIVFSKAT
jgi:ribosomal protein S18 acetylase RimI-like enzyme